MKKIAGLGGRRDGESSPSSRAGALTLRAVSRQNPVIRAINYLEGSASACEFEYDREDRIDIYIHVREHAG